VSEANLCISPLFKRKDISQYKVSVAARAVMERIDGSNIVGHQKNIGEFDSSFFSQFNIVISCVDSIHANRWINQQLLSLVNDDPDDPSEVDISTVIPFVVASAQDRSGEIRIFLPKISSCFECNLEPPVHHYHPDSFMPVRIRAIQDCIYYSAEYLWYSQSNSEGVFISHVEQFNPHDMEHITWCMNMAIQIARQFGIYLEEELTIHTVIGVLHNIIPKDASICSTIASQCVTEVLKLSTLMYPATAKCIHYNGNMGISTTNKLMTRNSDCVECKGNELIEISESITLGEFKDMISSRYFLLNANIRVNGKSLYIGNIASLEQVTKDNLKKPMNTLISNNDILFVTCHNNKDPFKIIVKFV
jgi:ubiquitin-activating enzyme E1 C